MRSKSRMIQPWCVKVLFGCCKIGGSCCSNAVAIAGDEFVVVGVLIMSCHREVPPGSSPCTYYRLGKANLARLASLSERPLPCTIKVCNPPNGPHVMQRHVI
jgi:hypothetical protein